MNNQTHHSAPIDLKHRFSERPKLLANADQAKQLAEQIKQMLAVGQSDTLRTMLSKTFPPDLARAMSFQSNEQAQAVLNLLSAQEAADVLDEVEKKKREFLVRGAAPERAARIFEELPSDESTDLVQLLNPDQVEPVLGMMDQKKAGKIRQLLAYPKESAGGIASLDYVAVKQDSTVGQAVEAFKTQPHTERILDLYVVDSQGAFKGVLDLRRLLNAEAKAPIRALVTMPVAAVPPEMDREQVAQVFAEYDLMTLPVVEPAPSEKLVGVITADDVIDVVVAEDTEDTMKMAGSDAQEMEKRSPVRTALLRLPWIMATMFIELGAGVVIHIYDATLARVLLLASFMPIISAISGNTGLQSATIIVRGLSTGQIAASEWRRALLRQLTMTLLLGAVTGLTLGIIGALWYGKWTFGLIVLIGMFAAVNIAGVVGTLVPLISKHLGYDPAITSGPFETAFQDVVGISIFLTLATVLLRFL